MTTVHSPEFRVIKRATLTTATTGTDVVAAVAGTTIKVIAYALQATGTVNANLRDGTGAALTLVWNLQAREGVSAAAAKPPFYLFATTAGNALTVVLSAAVTVGIEVTYWDTD
jgi:hypothetical protein